MEFHVHTTHMESNEDMVHKEEGVVVNLWENYMVLPNHVMTLYIDEDYMVFFQSFNNMLYVYDRFHKNIYYQTQWKWNWIIVSREGDMLYFFLEGNTETPLYGLRLNVSHPCEEVVTEMRFPCCIIQTPFQVKYGRYIFMKSRIPFEEKYKIFVCDMVNHTTKEYAYEHVLFDKDYWYIYNVYTNCMYRLCYDMDEEVKISWKYKVIRAFLTKNYIVGVYYDEKDGSFRVFLIHKDTLHVFYPDAKVTSLYPIQVNDFQGDKILIRTVNEIVFLTEKEN